MESIHTYVSAIVSFFQCTRYSVRVTNDLTILHFFCLHICTYSQSHKYPYPHCRCNKIGCKLSDAFDVLQEKKITASEQICKVYSDEILRKLFNPLPYYFFIPYYDTLFLRNLIYLFLLSLLLSKTTLCLLSYPCNVLRISWRN